MPASPTAWESAPPSPTTFVAPVLPIHIPQTGDAAMQQFFHDIVGQLSVLNSSVTSVPPTPTLGPRTSFMAPAPLAAALRSVAGADAGDQFEDADEEDESDVGTGSFVSQAYAGAPIYATPTPDGQRYSSQGSQEHPRYPQDHLRFSSQEQDRPRYSSQEHQRYSGQPQHPPPVTSPSSTLGADYVLVQKVAALPLPLQAPPLVPRPSPRIPMRSSARPTSRAGGVYETPGQAADKENSRRSQPQRQAPPPPVGLGIAAEGKRQTLGLAIQSGGVPAFEQDSLSSGGPRLQKRKSAFFHFLLFPGGE